MKKIVKYIIYIFIIFICNYNIVYASSEFNKIREFKKNKMFEYKLNFNDNKKINPNNINSFKDNNYIDSLFINKNKIYKKIYFYGVIKDRYFLKKDKSFDKIVYLGFMHDKYGSIDIGKNYEALYDPLECTKVSELENKLYDFKGLLPKKLLGVFTYRNFFNINENNKIDIIAQAKNKSFEIMDDSIQIDILKENFGLNINYEYVIASSLKYTNKDKLDILASYIKVFDKKINNRQYRIDLDTDSLALGLIYKINKKNIFSISYLNQSCLMDYGEVMKKMSINNIKDRFIFYNYKYFGPIKKYFATEIAYKYLFTDKISAALSLFQSSTNDIMYYIERKHLFHFIQLNLKYIINKNMYLSYDHRVNLNEITNENFNIRDVFYKIFKNNISKLGIYYKNDY